MAKRKNFTGNLFDQDAGFSNDATEARKEPDTMATLPEPGGPALENSDHTHDKRPLTAETPPGQRKAGRKTDETKSKRLNLLIRPGVLKQFAKIAYMQQTSVNDLINRLIAEHNEKEAGTIRQYDRLFKDKSTLPSP
ncbi:MAG: hypothetical protein HGB02_09725 [Chlorobiaceae bacterium]|nr:hypothetical protein [Chlorobiaceae bacterium]